MTCDLPNCKEEDIEIFLGLRVCQKHLDDDDAGEISLRDIAISEELADPITDSEGRVTGAVVISRRTA